MTYRNLVIYSGSFDPFTKGHVQTAIDTLNNHDALNLKSPPEILIVPVAHPIQGKHTASLEDRVRMINLAVFGRPNLSPLNFDEGLFGPITCYERLLNMREGGINPVAWVIGSDNYTSQRIRQLELDGVIAEGVILVVVQRSGYRLSDLRTSHDGNPITALSEDQIRDGKVVLLEQSEGIVSSTMVKELLLSGNDVSGLLPQGVLDYIAEQGLYLS